MLTICRPGGAGYFYTALAINIARLTARQIHHDATRRAMRVQFEFTQDDLIDSSDRVLTRSKVIRSWKWKGALSTGFLAWVFVLLLFYQDPLRGAFVGLLAAAISAALYWLIQERTSKKGLRDLYKEQFGNAKSFVCEVELRPEGVWFDR